MEEPEIKTVSHIDDINKIKGKFEHAFYQSIEEGYSHNCVLNALYHFYHKKVDEYYDNLAKVTEWEKIDKL